MTRIVTTIPEGTSVEDAARIMSANEIGILPIGDRRFVVGVITDRDITVRVVAPGRDAKHTPVSDVMTRRAFHCFEDDDVEDACFAMEDNGIRRLLVFNRQRDLVGILSLDDVAVKTRLAKLAGHTLSKVARTA
jgi:CBS domain-containing protein